MQQLFPSQIRIATRRSALAIRQSEMVRDAILRYCGHIGHECDVSLLALQTTGDANKEQSLLEIGGKGLFTKEIEEALLKGHAEIAMHSLKDMPVTMPDGLVPPPPGVRLNFCAIGRILRLLLFAAMSQPASKKSRRE